MNQFESIYQFINAKILPKYYCLTRCHLERDWEENFKEYYVRHNGKVSDDIELELNVIGDVLEYCEKSGIEEEFDDILILMTK